ncbi:ATP-binding protein [Streptomyces sp. NBC_01803]|uniref:ATP-binding protein n=1 Tax=Streptomyces sp. NBC_01803 TaxID=2975946 RepID=UPI002DDB785A|nr:ATP-binding protein [Streptomyces sp. NBC_01803]WSA42922.1 ATP-binding protein [Streptomyces sp. NBC_01803]
MAFSSHAQSPGRDRTAVLTDERLRFALPAVDASTSEARRRTRLKLAEWRTPDETCDDAQLVMSELVTNALRHTGSHTVVCELRLLGGLLRIAVTGDGMGPQEPPRPAAEEDESGRGLFLVRALATVWGVRPREGGRGHVVWADLPLTPEDRGEG